MTVNIKWITSLGLMAFAVSIGILLLVGLSNGAFEISETRTLILGCAFFGFGIASFLSFRNKSFAVFAIIAILAFTVWNPAVTQFLKHFLS